MVCTEKIIYYDPIEIGICVPVFNRPKHLSETLEALKKNKISKLYIFCDGPHLKSDNNELKNIKKVHEIVEAIDWCKVNFIKHKDNLGVKKNYMFVKEYMFNRYNKIIILDDDIIPNSDFVEFMSRCLFKYEDENKVKSITSYCPPIQIPKNYNYDIFFSTRHCSWGMATWKRVWNEFKQTEQSHKIILNSKKNKEILYKGGNDFLPMLIADYFGWNNSFHIWWAWTSIQNDGVNINPTRSLTRNIGHDNSGVHCESTSKFEVEISQNLKTLRFPKHISIDKELDKLIFNFNKLPNLTYIFYNRIPLLLIKYFVPIYKLIKKMKARIRSSL